MKGIAPTVDSVNDLINEEQDLEFIRAFRDLIRINNVLVTFVDFSFDDLYVDYVGSGLTPTVNASHIILMGETCGRTLLWILPW